MPDISEPPSWKFSGNIDAWFDLAATVPDVVPDGVHAKVEISNDEKQWNSFP